MRANDTASSLLYARFDAQVDLPPLLDRIRRAGVSDESIDVISPIPLASLVVDKPVTIPLYVLTIIAGAIGIGIGIFFAGGTAALYPLHTGGKAIVAPPVVGIISYETMMLIAIITTFFAMAVKILFFYSPGVRHDPAIDEGAIGVSVRLFPDDLRRPVLTEILQEAGAKQISGR